MNIMKDKMKSIKLYQLESMIGSDKYPQINWERVWQQIEHCNAICDIPKEEKLFQGQVELQFISATKFDATKGLKSALQRWELIEFIMRIARAWTTQNHYSRTFCSEHLNRFFEIYIDPISNNSQILKIRKIIHSSARLNELIFDNIKVL